MSSREMAMAADGSRLGRGLATLIGDVGDDGPKVDRGRAPRRVPIEFLRANPRNPRRSFSQAELDDLSNSITEHGVIQPIVVRAVRGTPDAFEIVAGERRWRASQSAGLHDVPIVVIDVSDNAALEIAIVENVQALSISTQSKKRAAITRLPRSSNAARTKSPRSLARAAVMSRT